MMGEVVLLLFVLLLPAVKTGGAMGEGISGETGVPGALLHRSCVG